MHITFSLINKVAVLDDSLFPEHPTIRHKQCEMLLPGDAAIVYSQHTGPRS